MNRPQLPELIEVLKLLSSPQNESIKEGEKNYNQLKANPDVLVTNLIYLIRASQDPFMREYSPVLLRPLVNPMARDTLWPQLSAQTKEVLKTELIASLQTETKESVIHKVTAAICCFASDLVSNNQWPDLLTYLIESTSSPIENLRESSYKIIGSMVADIASLLKPHIPLFKQLVEKGLNDPSPKVKISSLNTLSSLLSADSSQSAIFQPLLPLMIQTISTAILSNQEKEAQQAILTFIIIADMEPAWFKHDFASTYKAFFQIMESDIAEEETKNYCLEFFLTIAEKRASLMKPLRYLEPLIHLLLKWASQVEEIDIAKWNSTSENSSDDDTSSSASHANDALDRLSANLGKPVMDCFFKFLGPLLQSRNWNERYAGLLALTMICEGCKKFLTPHLKDIVQNVIRLADDENPRIKWAVYFCLGQMATDFGEDMHKIHDILVHRACHSLQDPNPKVQSSVCLFITAILDNIDSDIVKLYQDTLFNSLAPLLQSSTIFVAENSLNAFSSIVESNTKGFDQHYASFMPFLIKIIQEKTSMEYRVLRGRAIEAISLIGIAVGKDKFKDDCKNIMLYCANQKFAQDDPQVDFFLRAYTRFCQSLGADFTPFLPIAMGPLIEAIQAAVKIETRALGDEYEENVVADTSACALENKALALTLLTIYASSLEEHLFPWVEQIAQIAIQLVDYAYNEEVRINATALLPYLLRVTKLHFEKVVGVDPLQNPQLLQLFTIILEKLLHTIKEEEQLEVLSAKIKVLGECIEFIGKEKSVMAKSFDTLKSVMTTLGEYEEAYKEGLDEDDDDPQDSMDKEILDEAFNNMAVAIGDIIIANKDDSVPYVQEILSHILEHIENSNEEVVSSMVCIMDDFIEYGGPQVANLYAHIIPPLIKACKSNSESVRHAAAFGLGVAAQKGPAQFSVFITESLTVLNEIVTDPQSRSEDNLPATENSISAIGRIFNVLPPSFEQFLPTFLPQWVAFLPISDEAEQPAVAETLIDLCAKHNMKIYGPNFENLKKILDILGHSVSEKQISSELKDKLKQLLSQLVGNPQIHNIFQTVDEKSRNALLSL
eukprot:gene3634-4525_t